MPQPKPRIEPRAEPLTTTRHIVNMAKYRKAR